MNTTAGHIQQRQEKLATIKRLGFDPYPRKFECSHAVEEIVQRCREQSADALEREAFRVRTAGRLMAVRGHGKAAFGHLAGGGERLQIYVRLDSVGERLYELYKLLDLGDFIGVEGVMGRTRTGELTVFVEDLTFLSKALLPLPEKWHGLSDVEIRYRQRYLDLIANPSVREVFQKRGRLIAEIRRFLEARGYLEVETPMMQPVAGGASARPFKTFHEALGIPLYLRIAPELYLKRLVVGGFDRVFEINRNFRNEGISTQHNPEFTMLEFYQAYSDYRDLMDLTEELLRTVVEAVTGGVVVNFRGNDLDFGTFQRFTMVEAVCRFWREGNAPSPAELDSGEIVRALLLRLGLEPGEPECWGRGLGLLFEAVVDDRLVQPTFIYDFPVELSPLAKRKSGDPRFAERFELFAGGLELANAYSELNDPEEQLGRFEEQLRERARGDLEAHEMDTDYVKALRYGMPPTAGEGIGVDRLAMILTNSSSIREVILFPHLRPAAGQE
jgi:lysyl-tRNA synthetase, class II